MLILIGASDNYSLTCWTTNWLFDGAGPFSLWFEHWCLHTFLTSPAGLPLVSLDVGWYVYLPSVCPSLDAQQIANSIRHRPLRSGTARVGISLRIDTVRPLDTTCSSYLRYQRRYWWSVSNLVSSLDPVNLLALCFLYCSPLVQLGC